MPKSHQVGQRFWRPSRQARQRPQVTSGLKDTRWPLRHPLTLECASSTVATASCPITSPGLRRSLCPRKPWRSDPHTPAADTPSSTSPSRGEASGTDWISIRSGPT